MLKIEAKPSLQRLGLFLISADQTYRVDWYDDQGRRQEPERAGRRGLEPRESAFMAPRPPGSPAQQDEVSISTDIARRHIIFEQPSVRSHLTDRRESEKRLQPDPLKKDLNLAELWDLISVNYFSPITERTFSILEELYDPACASQHRAEGFDPHDQSNLLKVFNDWTKEDASPEALEKTARRPSNTDNAFLHFSLACKYYYPLLTANPEVGLTHEVSVSYCEMFADVWKKKLAAICPEKKTTAALAEEKNELLKLLEQPCKTNRSASSLVADRISQVEEELKERSEANKKLLETLVSSLSSQPQSFSVEFAVASLGQSQALEQSSEHAQNIDAKLTYLRKDLIKLENTQIAESIKQVESIPGQRNIFRVTFDSNIMDQQVDMSLEELLTLNKLREYSVFGIHRTGPKSSIKYFSYFKDFHYLCRDPAFAFEVSMPFNTDPSTYLPQAGSSQTIKKSQVRECQELAMCHHCKVLLPPETFFTCSKKCKSLQTEPCSLELRPGDLLRKSIMGFRIRVPPVCGKTYCQSCINGWYSYGQDTKISCPSCQKICFCTRCNRFDNIEKFAQIYERLGGCISELVRESPSSRLALRLLQGKAELGKFLNKLYEQRKYKESMPKEPSLSMNAAFNSQYKKLHLLKLVSKLVVVR
jgi:hypothetical protein